MTATAHRGTLRELDRRVRELLVAVRDPNADVGAAWSAFASRMLPASELQRIVAETPKGERDDVVREIRALSQLVTVTLEEARRERADVGAAIDRVHASSQSFAFYGSEGSTCDVAG